MPRWSQGASARPGATRARLGQNFGVILGINESEIRMKELVQDGGGDWTERTGTLQLIQADTKTQERKK